MGERVPFCSSLMLVVIVLYETMWNVSKGKKKVVLFVGLSCEFFCQDSIVSSTALHCNLVVLWPHFVPFISCIVAEVNEKK